MCKRINIKIGHLDCKERFSVCSKGKNQRYLYKDPITGPKTYNLGYTKRTYSPKIVTTLPYGSIDFETYVIEDGRLRTYLLGIYNPRSGFKSLRRCDYLTEEEFDRAVIGYFTDNPSLYFSFNGRNFDHILLNRILSNSGSPTSIFKDGQKVRKIRWRGCVFLDIMYWVDPCTLGDLAKTWLNSNK
jgi:hypothetical protein